MYPPSKYSNFSGSLKIVSIEVVFTVEPLYKGHIRTLEAVLYIEVVYSGNLSIETLENVELVL